MFRCSLNLNASRFFIFRFLFGFPPYGLFLASENVRCKVFADLPAMTAKVKRVMNIKQKIMNLLSSRKSYFIISRALSTIHTVFP